jgi:hypothetical protein
VAYTFEHWVNQVMHAHPLLARAAVEFSSWGVALFGVMAVGLWLLSPPGHTTWKRACAAGLSAAAVGLLVNQWSPCPACSSACTTRPRCWPAW